MGEELDTSIGGKADKAWFAERHASVRRNSEAQAVSDAVASAHLSGVDLPADWVETLGKVARGEVTADDAVRSVVYSELHYAIKMAVAKCWGYRTWTEVAAIEDGQASSMLATTEAVLAVVAPMLAAKDRDVEQIRIRLAQTLNLPHSRTLDQLIDDVSEVFSGWVRMAREVGGLRRELKFTEGFRQQYAEERDAVLRRLEMARIRLAEVMGTSHTLMLDELCTRVGELRAELEAVRARAQLAEDERDKANRQNESLARRLHLRFQNEQKLSAELAAVKAGTVIVPDDAGREVEMVLASYEKYEPSMTLAEAIVDLLDNWRGQPDTEPRHVDIDIVDHVVTGEAIAENPEWAHTGFVMAADVRTIIREWCAANGIPVDTEATEQAELGSDVVVLSDNWEEIVATHLTYVDGRCGCGEPCPDQDALARHRDAVLSPAAPTEPRVWHQGDPEPPIGTTVRLVDRTTRTRHELGWLPGPWNWFGLTEIYGSVTEVIVDGTQ